MNRLLLFILAIVLAVGVLCDPFTFSLSYTDYTVAPRWWQTSLQLADLVILGVFMSCAALTRWRMAYLVMAFETLFRLTLEAAWLRGVDGEFYYRLAYGFTRNTISLFLLGIALRILVLDRLFTAMVRDRPE